ncbi:hypothetical protein [Phycicoccus flavus]|uniref:hypothetical protein n=1 Tax=Phycicoccus flavus TaxID=2502783 RepID=UPI000FEB6F50|nr:hypothetical protein [Phycicoccus flavus]NHA68763.1 hypothetical protein [Phycicoccus flavus]
MKDSFQDQWTTQAVKNPDYGQPEPGHRYTFDQVGGRVFTIFPAAFGGGVLSDDPLRVKADAPGPRRVTVWVTKPKPDPDLDVSTAVDIVLARLTAIMSTQHPERDGFCTVRPSPPLPPINQNTPDDTPTG